MAYSCLVLIGTSCGNQNQEILNEEVYEGPYIEMKDVETLLSDSAIIRLKILAPVQQIFDNEDENFPEGMSLEIYEVDQSLTATFRSNTAFKNAEEKYYVGRGDVVVRNMESGDELNTEELFWYQSESVFRTDKFVTIKSEGEVHTGEGLEATQDFSYYIITNPTGTIPIDDPEAIP